MQSNNLYSAEPKAGFFFQVLIICAIFIFINLSCSILFAAQVKITFDPSPDPRTIGHKLFYGKTKTFSEVVDLKNTTTFITPDLQDGTTYYFAAKAYDSQGNESAFSDILSYKIPEKSKSDNVVDFPMFFENFEGYPAGADPVDWFDTKANNSMAEDNNLFKIFTLNSNKVFGTRSTLSNIHSHNIRSYVEKLSFFEYSGRMMMTDTNGGIGVTFLSHYPFADNYYRLRSNKNKPFHISAHPNGKAVFGIIDSTLTPKANQWYRFRILVQDTGLRTEILAKVWLENTSEPSKWQIDAYDNTSNRFISGTVGVWSDRAGAKYWDDLTLYQ